TTVPSLRNASVCEKPADTATALVRLTGTLPQFMPHCVTVPLAMSATELETPPATAMTLDMAAVGRSACPNSSAPHSATPPGNAACTFQVKLRLPDALLTVAE